MKQITLHDGRTLISVEIPDAASGYLLGSDAIWFNINHGLGNVEVEIPEVEYNVMGISSELTEGDLFYSFILERYNNGRRDYKWFKKYDKKSARLYCVSCKSSWDSFCRHHSITPNELILITVNN